MATAPNGFSPKWLQPPENPGAARNHCRTGGLPFLGRHATPQVMELFGVPARILQRDLFERAAEVIGRVDSLVRLDRPGTDQSMTMAKRLCPNC